MRDKLFREDLYYRLNVVSIRMPPLRERPHDLAQMAAGYLTFFCNQCGKRLDGFSPEVQSALQRYAWPGNLRELRNVIEHAVIFASGHRIELADLPEQLLYRNGSPFQSEVHVGMKIPWKNWKTNTSAASSRKPPPWSRPRKSWAFPAARSTNGKRN